MLYTAPRTSARAVPRFLRPRVVATVWAVLWLIVVVGELLPAESTPIELLSETNISDKVLHFGAYVTLAFLPVLGFSARRAAGCVIAVGVVSIGLEFAQLLVPGRTCELGDAVANTLGLAVGALLAVAVKRLLTQRRAGR